MSVLDVCMEVARKVGIKVPTTVFGSVERTQQSLGDLANEMASQICFDSGHDWGLLKTVATITGDGTTTQHSLPSDYRRMIKKATLWPSSTPYTTLTHVPDRDTWLGYDEQTFVPLLGYWSIFGGYMNVKPAIASAETVKYIYLSNLVVAPVSGSNKTKFTVDTDTFRLTQQGDTEVNERLLRLAMIWKWKADHSQAFAEDLADFELAKAQMILEDKGSNILTLNTRSAPLFGHNLAYPGTLGS